MTYLELASVLPICDEPAEAVRCAERPLGAPGPSVQESAEKQGKTAPKTAGIGLRSETASADGSVVLSVVRLARRLGAGDVRALERLYDILSERFLRYALTLLRDRHDAEDALQACMVRIAEKPLRVADSQYPYAYCLRILRNEALRLLSRRKRARPLPQQLEQTCVAPPCEEDEWKRKVQASLEDLPTEQMEVVVLKIWEGMTFLEIAEVVGASPNTVASRYRYALEKLSRLLQPLVEDLS
ncbi:MAG: sigma-70 family RNA polymerase sigma factor [Planctomycetes bacterium]|nr:sigma-70 family RNA polymerase sigma factor [Planctomycetota bacterium]